MDTSKKKTAEQEGYFSPRPGVPARGGANWWVIKIGGSLFDRPGLGPRLQSWLAQQPTQRLLLIPGGGAIAEALRTLDQRQQLGEESCHWLAIGGMSLMARSLAAMLPGSSIITSVMAAAEVWARHDYPIMDVMDFLRRDEADAQHLPHTWVVTSDSIAARIAVVHGAARLILLKSCPVPAGMSLEELAESGIVDAWFPRLAKRIEQVEVMALE